ncbi:MAG: AAA family ATPase [Gammaproteobacteria bacterium]
MIGVFKKKADLPEYLAHYGMHRPPFLEAPEDDMYYSEPTRKQRLDILLHLTQYTNELLVVIGEKGMGKTMFLRQFIKNAGDHWKICHIDAHAMMSEEQFLQRVYMGFNITHASNNKTTMLANLKKRLENQLQQALPVILVVDNAHLFPKPILRIILELASLHNPTSNTWMRVALFSEPQIKITLAEPELDERHKLIVRKIDLPPLNETHTGYYLHHRLSQAGMQVEQFLTKPTVAKIYKQSRGIPQKINEAADKLLFETTPIIRRTSHVAAQQKKMAGAKYIVMTIILLLVAGGYGVHFYFQGNDRNHKPMTVTNNPEKQTVQPVELPPLADTKDKTPLQKQTQPEAKAGKPVAGADDPMQALKDELSVKSTGQKKSSGTNGKSKQAASSPQITLPSAEARLKDADWLLSQDADYYTLQLVTGHQQSTIANFIKKHQLDPRDLSYFYSSRNGKNWHNLTYGVFPDRKTANNAIKDLPADLAGEKPWIRQMRIIQSEIVQSR